MNIAKLKTADVEFLIERPVTTIGRTADNDVSFTDDSNVSRYHAEIELREGEYYLIDPGSSNGTTVNGTKVLGEIRLNDGDQIVFAGSSSAEFEIGPTAAESEPDSAASNGQAADIPGINEANYAVSGLGDQAGYAAADALRNAAVGSAGGTAAEAAGAASTGTSSVTYVAAAVCGLAVVAAAAAGAVYFSRGGSSCSAAVQILSPESGDTISKPTSVSLAVSGDGCAAQAEIMIAGKKVASAAGPEYSATIDPASVPELADGNMYPLEAVLVDTEGKRISAAGGVLLAFDAKAGTKPATNTVVAQPANQDARPVDTSISLLQMQEMATRLLRQFSGSFAYDLSNKQLLQEIQRRTSEYVSDGYSTRAAAYRDVINVAFVREQNIDPPLGFYLAMSRSRFDPAKKGDGEGLWQMSEPFVVDNKYNGVCGSEKLTDNGQNCAAKAASLYMKAITTIFDKDPVLSAAAFGKTTDEAVKWKQSLPAKTADIGNAIRTPAEREQIVRFFAAGIVAENPQKFGLTKDRPLSELFRIAVN